MDNIDAGKIFPGHQVDVVSQFLNPAEARYNHTDNDDHHHQQSSHKAGGNGGKRPALAHDLNDRPYCHNRRFDDDLEPHGHQHLDLGDIVGGSVNQTGDGEGHHLFLPKVRNFLENQFPGRIAESGGYFGGEIAADDT